jgi:hypothetical protein
MTPEMLKELMHELEIWIQDDEMVEFLIHVDNKEIMLTKEISVDIDPRQSNFQFN